MQSKEQKIIKQKSTQAGNGEKKKHIGLLQAAKQEKENK